MSKVLFLWQIILSLVLIILISLTVVQVKKLKIPKISDIDIVFWLIELN